jgi:hypothetical protein
MRIPSVREPTGKGSNGSNRARAERVSGLMRAARQARFSVRSYMGPKTSRGDIIIGRPALILKAWPWTHDTISHLYGVDDGEALPVA